MNITLYEKVDKQRLIDVIECENLPFDGIESEEWKTSMKTQLRNYLKKLKDGKVEIEYKQKFKWGRFYSKMGFQGFKRDIRKYLNNENDCDIDMVNCHPVILEQLFKKHKIDCGDQLRNYNKDRNKFISENNLNDKLDFIKIINNEDWKSG